MVPSTEIFDTGLVTLVNFISVESRYSYIYGGSAQVLDHILANRAAVKNTTKFGYAQIQCGFSKSLFQRRKPTRTRFRPRRSNRLSGY